WELMAVVARGKRMLQVSRKLDEAREVLLPLGRREFAEPDTFRPALVAVAQHVAPKPRRRHGIEERIAECRVSGIRPVACGDGHQSDRLARTIQSGSASAGERSRTRGWSTPVASRT